MVIKPEYSKYKQRLFDGLARVFIISVVWTLFLLLNDFDRVGTFVALGIFGALSLILIISIIRKNKYYLTEIKVEGEDCEFTINEFDKPKETIKTKLGETRIILWELFFPFIKIGRNYKLIVETKQGLTYKRIIQQYEVGEWDLTKFKEVIKLYGESKGITVSTKSFKRTNF